MGKVISTFYSIPLTHGTYTLTFPFHPRDPEVPGLPKPAGRFRILPVPLIFDAFPNPLPTISLPLLPLMFDHVPVAGRHATQ